MDESMGKQGIEAARNDVRKKQIHIFALKEASVIILCTETAKDMIEAVGIKDVRFTELPVE